MAQLFLYRWTNTDETLHRCSAKPEDMHEEDYSSFKYFKEDNFWNINSSIRPGVSFCYLAHSFSFGLTLAHRTLDIYRNIDKIWRKKQLLSWIVQDCIWKTIKTQSTKRLCTLHGDTCVYNRLFCMYFAGVFDTYLSSWYKSSQCSNGRYEDPAH